MRLLVSALLALRTGYPDFGWSPDGRFLAFSFARPAERPSEYRQQIAVMSVDGGAPRPVTANTGWHPRWVR